MKKLSEAVRIAKRSLIALFAVIAAVSAYGRTVSVSSVETDPGWSRRANLQFSAGAPAVLHVAWGAADGGSDIDAWDHHRPVAMIDGSTTTYSYMFPEEMGDDVAAVRFFLLEDYDIPLTKRYAYVQTDGSQYVETSFVPTGHSAVEMQLSLNSVDSSVALCCARKDVNNRDSFTVFYLTGSGWRFDYYTVGSAAGPVAVADQPYALRMEGSGMYLDGSCISTLTPVSTVSERSLLLFGAKYGDTPDASYRASMKLYSMKAWSDSADVTSIALDLIPTELDGEPCLYNRIDGTYLKSARSGYPLSHGEEVAINRPAVLASSASVDVSGIWSFDGRAVRVSSVEKDSDGNRWANLQFSAGDPAVLHAAWGAADGGSDIDAWDHHRPVAMIDGSTTTYSYMFPEEMGDDVAAVRFFLLEDYDIPLTKRYAYVQTDGSQYVETSFVPTGHSAVEMQLSLNSVDSSVALCCARKDVNNRDSFTVFYLTGSGWRFDYYTVGSAAGPVAVADQPYALRMEGSGMYLDGSCISTLTPVSTVSERSLLLFGAKYGDTPDASYRASMKLYSMKAWSNSTDATSIALDLVPTEHDGEACLYNKIDGTYLKSARSGCPLAHGAEVAVNRPAVLSSSASLNVSGTWHVDCVNGNDANLGTYALSKQTIRAATTYALSGDVIYVSPGTYGVAEGSQLATATAKIGTRVVIPKGVTIESTGGAKDTFIVGAAAEGENIDNATYGTGTNAVRCVYAMDGATLRGFTLTGGRGIGTGEASGDGRGAAFCSETARGATVEDCIISNNVAHSATINQAVVRSCRVIGNTSTIANNGISGSAGYWCSWHNCIIAKNIGNATVFGPVAFESCTLGSGNNMSGGGSAQVLYWWDGNDHAIKNCAVLYGRYYCVSPGKISLKNCLVMAADVDSLIDVGLSYNTIFTNSAAAQVNSEYRPVFGSFTGIDAGDASYSTDALGDKDAFGTPRILNGALDIGAVEYDWCPTFNAEIGRRFKLTYASPTVTTNATGGLRLDGDVGTLGERALPVCIAGTVTSAGPYTFTFEMTGGSAAVYVGGVLAGEASGTGEQLIHFDVPDAAAEIRFVFTPDAQNPGAVLLRKFAGGRGFSIIFW